MMALLAPLALGYRAPSLPYLPVTRATHARRLGMQTRDDPDDEILNELDAQVCAALLPCTRNTVSHGRVLRNSCVPWARGHLQSVAVPPRFWASGTRDPVPGQGRCFCGGSSAWRRK